MSFINMHVSTEGGTFALISTVDPKTHEVQPDAALKTLEDDTIYIDSTDWLRDVFLPSVIQYHVNQKFTAEMMDSFSEDVLMTISQNSIGIINMFKTAKKMKML